MRLALLSVLTIFVFAPDVSAQSAARDNKTMARRYFEILNKGDLDEFDAIVAPDVVFRNPPAVVRGIDAFRKVVASLRAAFPDLHFTLEDEFGEDEQSRDAMGDAWHPGRSENGCERNGHFSDR